MLYTINVHSAICQLYLDKIGRIKKEKEKVKKKKNRDMKFLLEMQINPSIQWEKYSVPYKLHIGKKRKCQK